MARRTIGAGIAAGLGAAAALFALSATGQAQEPHNRAGWQPFLGCWSRVAAQVDATAGAEGADPGVLCFAASDGQVEMLTIAGGAITHREPFPADRQPWTVEQDGCTGTETGRFSDDRRRIYVTSDVICDDGTPIRTSGIIAMTGGSRWIDVRAVERDGEVAAWSQWYRRTDTGALEALGISTGAEDLTMAMRIATSFVPTNIDVGDVIDAAEHVHPRAVEAWIAETGEPFAGLDADDLVALDEAGVPGEVIDVVVAVSFPRRFAFNRQEAVYQGEADVRPRRTVWAQRTYDPFRYGSWGYSPYYGYGLYNPYGYGYGYGGYYGRGGGYYRPVIVDRAPASADDGGRVVAGRGYRGPRSTMTPSSGGSSGSSGAWTRSSGGSRSSGTATRGGSGGGGSRKARPRRPGGE